MRLRSFAGWEGIGVKTGISPNAVGNSPWKMCSPGLRGINPSVEVVWSGWQVLTTLSCHVLDASW